MDKINVFVSTILHICYTIHLLCYIMLYHSLPFSLPSKTPSPYLPTSPPSPARTHKYTHTRTHMPTHTHVQIGWGPVGMGKHVGRVQVSADAPSPCSIRCERLEAEGSVDAPSPHSACK